MRMTIVLVAGLLSVLSLNMEVKAQCYPNGCSVWNIVPYKQFFTSACNKHDVCYACGVRNAWSRYQCDLAFLRDMQTLCQGRPWLLRVHCRKWAIRYYGAVRAFGDDHYEDPSLWWCNGCPRSKGDPSFRR